ncbi:endo alpha-1,4 polygalactosaminidase [Tumebacillus permanentifrigoris]|uniref:Endo-alpha-1,4-polygalactosaminidase (GH114 family) n=1 Tax=Tumebacillus permanentifrigoris TaxID=378543 RepID=A0A316DFE0_9BACL|nr:endo alpha-1,4 polygalactosaminidase [Tumebacillus permanentifrigoris]PWK14954.1 endo-alpha-1,4-polygalactosaminidase (GH114 family) [Tumebacillus permanentifrigoris]
MKPIRSYQIYYGPVTPLVQERLSGHDLLILEPRHVDSQTVLQLKSAGALVIGYLSVLETPTWNEQRFARLQPADTLTLQGQKVHFPEWDSYLMDIRQLSYQATLLQEVLDLILVKQMDGVFLDTVGDLEEYVPAGRLRDEMMTAYREFLQRLRTLAPDVLLIQNRGFDTLPLAAPHLQGLLWEDWRGDLLPHPWVQERVQRLRGLHVLTVSPHDDPIHAATSKRQGFTHLTRSTDYLLL